MRTDRYHKITEDDDIGIGYIIKATLTLLLIAAVFALWLCLLVPFHGSP